MVTKTIRTFKALFKTHTKQKIAFLIFLVVTTDIMGNQYGLLVAVLTFIAIIVAGLIFTYMTSD